MLNKCASSAAGQGSNDEFQHLIQVNARKFNLFRALCMKYFRSKQTPFGFGLFVSGSVGE